MPRLPPTEAGGGPASGRGSLRRPARSLAHHWRTDANEEARPSACKHLRAGSSYGGRSFNRPISYAAELRSEALRQTGRGHSRGQPWRFPGLLFTFDRVASRGWGFHLYLLRQRRPEPTANSPALAARLEMSRRSALPQKGAQPRRREFSSLELVPALCPQNRGLITCCFVCGGVPRRPEPACRDSGTASGYF